MLEQLMRDHGIERPYRRIPMIGRSFGRLKVIKAAGRNRGNSLTYECLCSCGNSKVVVGDKLRSGHTRSCGCLNADRVRERSTKHGATNTPTYRIWRGMISRCTNSNLKAFPRYGGRGIQVCDRWRIYENFLADMGERPDGLELDRINNNGHYEPSNCRWASRQENCNNRRNNVIVHAFEEAHNLAQWSVITGVNKTVIRERLLRGWAPEDAVLRPTKANPDKGIESIVFVPATDLVPRGCYHVRLRDGWLAEHIGRGDSIEAALRDALERVHGRVAA